MTKRDILEGKALVAGATGGMGRAVALALARQGLQLALLGRDAQAVDDIARQCRNSGAQVHEVICDIARTNSIEVAVKQAIEGLGGLNYLVNCAGISPDESLCDGDLSGAEAILDTNLRAHLHLARHALPEINRTSGGAVVKIGAVNWAYPGASTYTAANRGTTGPAQFAYYDTRPLMGCMLEVVTHNEAIVARFAEIARAAEGWNGEDPIRG